MAVYVWLTKTNAVAALEGRLNSGAFWTASELWVCLTEALRHWNGLTEQWNQPVAIPNAGGAWVNTGTLAGSPRLRSVTDQYLYNQMASMLLEPPLSGGAWAGSSQFTLANLQYALQKRTQEVIQATSCNIALLSPVNATPGMRSGYPLPDTVLEPRRMRLCAAVASTTATALSGLPRMSVASTAGIAAGQLIAGAGIQAGTFVTGIAGTAVIMSQPTTAPLSVTPVQFFQPWTLTREDVLSFQSFDPGYLQEFGHPESWTVASEPPLSFDVDIAPNTAGYFDVLALNSGPTFAPPAASLLGVPDDWSMVPLYGAMADVLGIDAESTDRLRSAYCLQRYEQMLGMMKESNWLLQALINGQVSNTVSLDDMDSLAVGWQESQANLPAVVEAGVDMLAPVPAFGQALAVTLVGNAPLLDATGVYVQVSRDDFEAVLNYAQHLASFKLGNQMFEATMPMLQGFYQAAAAVNDRWAKYGKFVPELRDEGKKQAR